MSEAISGKERDTDPGFRFNHPGYGRFGRLVNWFSRHCERSEAIHSTA
jgi:hypothetical protein